MMTTTAEPRRGTVTRQPRGARGATCKHCGHAIYALFYGKVWMHSVVGSRTCPNVGRR